MSNRKTGIGSILAPVAVVIALGGLSQIEPKIPVVHVDKPAIEMRDRFFSIAASPQGMVWVVGKNGKVVRSEDKGEAWAVQSPPVSTNWQDIALWDDARAVIVGSDGLSAATVDGGVSWSSAKLPVSDVAGKVLRVGVGPDGRAWAVAELGVIAYSDDFGKSWQRSPGDEEDVAWNAVGFAGTTRVCVVGEFGRIKCTEDQGATWLAAQSPSDTSLMAIVFRDSEHGLAVGLNGLMIATADAGRTWTQLATVTDRHLFDVAWDGGQWVVVGDKGTLAFAGPEGSDWQVQRVSNSDFAWHTRVVPIDSDLYISGQTAGIWSAGTWRPFLKRG